MDMCVLGDTKLLILKHTLSGIYTLCEYKDKVLTILCYMKRSFIEENNFLIPDEDSYQYNFSHEENFVVLS